VLLLVDSRLEPQRIDLEFLRWLVGCEVAISLVFTKADKQSSTRTRAAIDAFLAAAEFLPDPAPPVLASSSTTRAGRDELLAHLARRLADVRR